MKSNKWLVFLAVVLSIAILHFRNSLRTEQEKHDKLNKEIGYYKKVLAFRDSTESYIFDERLHLYDEGILHTI